MKEKNRIFSLLLSLWCIMSVMGCDEKNTSAPVPAMVSYLTSSAWRIDSIVLEDTEDTLRTVEVPGLANSYLKFNIGTTKATYVFEDYFDNTLKGPKSLNIPTGDTTLFRYNTGVWSLNVYNDSIITKADTLNDIFRWQILDTTASTFSVRFIDSIPVNNIMTPYPKLLFFSRWMD